MSEGFESMQQLTFDDFMPIRYPCGRRCMYAWCSLKCFFMRGYIRDKETQKWIRDEEGNPIIFAPKCDWKPKGD